MLSRSPVLHHFPKNFPFNSRKPLIRKRFFTLDSHVFFSTSSGKNGKPNVLLLGAGWSSIFFIKNLNPKLFDLTVISPRNFFTFTPLLPKILSGMINSNTSTEPIVDYMKRYFKKNSRFIHAKCVDVDTQSNSVTCAPVDSDSPLFTVPYDYLVIGVGATTNTFGIQGVEKYAYFLKEVEHAELAFQKILDNFRRASMPFLSDDEKKRLLHFVVVGGGPTGVESTGELSVLLNRYLKKTYPDLMPFVRLSIVEGGQRLLPSLRKSSSDYVLRLFQKNSVNTYFGKVVCEVRPESCVLKELATGATEEVDCGLVLWASGLKETDLTLKLKKKWNIPENSRALLVDQYLRLHGTNNVFCLGDCCKISPTPLAENVDFILEKIGTPTVNSLVKNRKSLSKEFPQLNDLKWKFKEELFKNAVAEIESSHGKDTRESFVEILSYIDKSYASPFPTAQNAKQEAVYLAKMFNSGSVSAGNFKGSAFCEVWNGTLASLGGLKVIVNSPFFNINGGPLTFLMWNGVYMLMFSSLKMRVCFTFDLFMSFFARRHLVFKRYNK